MFRSRYHLVALTTILIILAGCTRKGLSEKDALFVEMIAVKDINQSIVMNYDARPKENMVTVVNQSSRNTISFPPDAGVKIYTYDEDQQKWIEIENRKMYGSKAYSVLQTKSSGTISFITVSFSPDIGTHKIPKNVRVLVIGKIHSDGLENGQKAAAFTDVPFIDDFATPAPMSSIP